MEETTQQQNDLKKSACGYHKTPCKMLGGVLMGLFIIVLMIYFIQLTQNVAKERLYIGQDIASNKTISVSDSAEVYAKPDLAVTTATVVSNAQTVAVAYKDNTTKMNKIIEMVKSKGVEEKDLKTTAFNIYPQYEYPAPSYKRFFTGYEVRQSLMIKIRDLEKVGEIIEGVTGAGANEMTDLQFTVDKPDELQKQARKEAIQKAKAKAQDLASQLGVRLVRISSFSESGGSVPVPYMDTMKGMGIGGGESSISPQIQTGENKIQVSVYITYEIN